MSHIGGCASNQKACDNPQTRAHCSQGSLQLSSAQHTRALLGCSCQPHAACFLLSAPFLELKPLPEVAGGCGWETGRRRELLLLPVPNACRPGCLGQRQKRLEKGSHFSLPYNERDTSVLMRERMATNYFSPVPAVRSPGSNSS